MNKLYEQFNGYLCDSNLWECERPADSRWILNLKTPCKDGGKFIIEVSVCEPSPLWFKKKYTSQGKIGSHFISVQTYAYNKDGACYSHYNPQITPQGQINFDFIMGASLSNLKTLIVRTIELAYDPDEMPIEGYEVCPHCDTEFVFVADGKSAMVQVCPNCGNDVLLCSLCSSCSTSCSGKSQKIMEVV